MSKHTRRAEEASQQGQATPIPEEMLKDLPEPAADEEEEG